MNHGVRSSLVEKLKSEIGEFYKLPLEERMKYKMMPGDIEGYGLLPIRSEDQKLDWGDRFYMITNPIHTRKPYLLGRHLFYPGLDRSIFCSGRPYHRTVPDGGITAGMGRGPEWPSQDSNLGPVGLKA